MIEFVSALLEEAYSKKDANAIKDCFSGKEHLCYIETYGCQMNVRDSEIMYGLLESCGYQKTDDKKNADVILFNTCCVREHAEKRVFGNVGSLIKLKQEKPDLIVGVCGCMMQQKGVAERLMKRFPFLNFIMGTHMTRHLPEILSAVLNGERIIAVGEETDVIEGLPSLRSDAASAFVNINYGCNNYCTYCIVPYVRGKERSRKPEDILKEIKELTEQGWTEITLLGQNVNSYGKDLGSYDFSDLIKDAASIPGVKRLRFMTSHPKDLNDKLINAIASTPKVCHHVHLPFQSGSDSILKRMNRHYTREHYIDIVRKLRSAVPDIELTTDIIVGFPGETECDFEDTLQLVSEIGFATAFTFKYSPRNGTPAARMPDQIDEEVKTERLNRLNELQNKKTYENNEKYVGFEGEVLIEGIDVKTGMKFGKYPNFKMIYFDCPEKCVGDYVKVKATRVRGNSLAGEYVEGD